MAGVFNRGASDGMSFPSQNTLSQGPPARFNPRITGGRVPARWTVPYSGYNQPLLEMPQNKFLRISLAMNAWLGEPIINASSKLTLCLALEKLVLSTVSRATKMPSWIPPEAAKKFLNQYDGNVGRATAAYVKQECLDLLEFLDVKTFFEGQGLDVMTSGDAYVNVATNCTPAEENYVWEACRDKKLTMKRVQELKDRMLQDGRGEYDIFALQSLNPSAVWLYPDYAGRIVNGKVVHLMGEGVHDVNLDNLIHLKAPSFNWVVYGISYYISALKWVDIKFAMMDALWTNANRYVSPKEWLQIAGPEAGDHSRLPPTEEQMQFGQDIISQYAANVPFILPEGWEFKYLGAEGKVLKVEGLIDKIDDAIRTAAQISKTFAGGSANVPAYATSKLQAGIMMKAIAPLMTLVARAIEGRILQRFCLFRGFFEEDGTLICPKVEFKSMPIQGDDGVERKLQTLGLLGIISPQTAWEMEGIDPGLEMERINMARLGLTEPFRSIAPDMAPSQDPERFNELNQSLTSRRLMIDFAKAAGHKKLVGNIEQFMYNDSIGDCQAAERNAVDLCKYLAQATYLQRKETSEQPMDGQPINWQEQVLSQPELYEAMRKGVRDKEMNGACAVTSEVRTHRERVSAESKTAGVNGCITN